MKKRSWWPLVLVAVFVFGGLGLYADHLSYKKNQKQVLFPSPQNLAQKVANFVMANGEKSSFNDGTAEEGTDYSYKVYSGYQIWELEVKIYKEFKNQQKSLHINYYSTNRPVENFKTPADLVAHELMYGTAKIHIEEHVSDYGVDGEVDIFQQYTKKRGSMYMGFTREERDLGEKAGVQDYLYDIDALLKNENLLNMPPEKDKEIKQINDEYGKHLFVISEKLKIK